MWDTGVKCGDLQAHGRRRGLTCAPGGQGAAGVLSGRREFVLLLLLRDCPSLSFFPFVGRRRREGGGQGLNPGIRR
jgi:hypothetical protein